MGKIATSVILIKFIKCTEKIIAADLALERNSYIYNKTTYTGLFHRTGNRH